jgi:glycerol-3-phosphate dehydrogenase
VAELIGAVLGWSDAQRTTEVETYGARVAAERASQARSDDAAADAVRTTAPEVRGALVSPAAGSTSPLR